MKLVASISSRLPPVGISPHWLTQAVLNMIINSGEAIAPAKAGRVRVHAELPPDRREVRLVVADNGRGMSAAVQRRALDVFFTTKSRSMGTGLGLPLARRVVVRAGGRIEIHSRVGEGTVVTLAIPVVAEPVNAGDAFPVLHPCAAISVRDPRTAAQISQFLVRGGVQVPSRRGDGPGAVDLWVVEPSARALRLAVAWCRRKPGRVVVLLGVPARTTRSSWARLDAHVIEAPDDPEAARHALTSATRAVLDARVTRPVIVAVVPARQSPVRPRAVPRAVSKRPIRRRQETRK